MKCNEPVKLFMKIDLTSEYSDSNATIIEIRMREVQHLEWEEKTAHIT